MESHAKGDYKTSPVVEKIPNNMWPTKKEEATIK